MFALAAIVLFVRNHVEYRAILRDQRENKHFYEYVQETSRALDGLIRELRKAEPAP
jgi:hypothetical protein